MFGRKVGGLFGGGGDVTTVPVSDVKSFSFGVVSQSAVNRLTEEQKEEIQESYFIFDPSETGLDAKALRAAMRSLGFDPSKDDLRKLMNNNAIVDETQFMEIMAYQMNLQVMEDELRVAFELFDKEKSGRITLQNLRQAVASLGENLTDDDLVRMIEAADLDKDGEVSFEEYSDIMVR
uniref:EF-hand domain-containing protein n=1 Tax=Timspurckia oligopyrenoides TaxID=708627 RepID=A0A7S0ZIC9_9RHOD